MITSDFRRPQKGYILKINETVQLPLPEFIFEENATYFQGTMCCVYKNFLVWVVGQILLFCFGSQLRAQITHQLYGGDGLAPL